MIRYALRTAAVVIAAAAWTGASFACAGSEKGTKSQNRESLQADSLKKAVLHQDSIAVLKADSATRYSRLTHEDFKLVADELGLDVATLRAVVVIEAGNAMEGFAAPGVPIVNFDPSMYKIYAPKAPDKKGNPNAKVPENLKGYQLKEWSQLTNARKKNAQGADMGTFWGMFQIGGFNYKLCDCETVNEMVERMSYSELEQLELFARFIVNCDYVKYLKSKDWAGFARKYNGKSYAKRGYHTKMAVAYARFKKEEAEYEAQNRQN